MTETLQIQLLGGFLVTLNGQAIRAFRTAKTRALLAYLAVEADREHRRTNLATLFWGELPDAAAKTNLRIELSNLKSLLASHPAFEIARDHVCLHSALATIDLEIFQRTIADFLALPIEAQGADLAKLAGALDLYQGEFLSGFQANDAPDFEDWQLLLREQLHEDMMLGLKTLQNRYAELGRWTDLAGAARRQLALEPWTESAHRSLMQALAAQGQVQAALLQFDRCRAILQEELGVEPSLPTLELAARLRGEGPGLLPAKHNLSQQLKALVGRKQEITQLLALVKTERLVTLLGIGGVGKSHLAQAAALHLLSDFADGVWFVPLANLEAGLNAGELGADSIALAIAAAVGFPLTNVQNPLAELVAHLAPKQMLIILDNCEHVREAVTTLLFELLPNSRAHILATSRVRLMLDGENVVPLEGLPEQEAYTLFVDRARRVVPAFAMTENGDAKSSKGGGESVRNEILKICDQLAGLPLGIEVAASWVEHYSVAEIGRSILEVGVQPQQRDGMLQRHHRLSNVFEFSWQLLSPLQQQILSYLSIFRGGFDRAAVSAVVQSTLNDLSVLIAHSLVQRVSAGRYDLHPLIQEFGAGKVVAEQAGSLQSRYVRHYLPLLVMKPRPQWKGDLLDDFENIRKAWQQAVQAGDATSIEQAATIFGDFMGQFGLLADTNELFATAIAQFEEDAAQRELVARLIDQQAFPVRALKGLAEGALLAERLLTFTADPKMLARGHYDLANYYAEIGDWQLADFHFDSMEALAEESSNLALYVDAVEVRIHINAIHFRGDFVQGIARLEELLALLDSARGDLAKIAVEDEQRLRSHTTQSIVMLAIRYGDYGLALRVSQQVLAVVEENAPRRRHVLQDMALAEQFAGLYAEAIAHFRQSLAICEEVGDVDEIGLLKANLCLTLRQSGEFEQALAYGLEAVEILAKLGSKRVEGQARNRVGHTLSLLGRWADAYTTYGDALVVWATMQHPNRYEAVAGRAMAALRLGYTTEALALVEEALAFVAGKGVIGLVEPARFYLNCEAVLMGLSQPERANALLLQAVEWVQTIAARISDESVRAAFLNHRPDNQLLKTQLSSQ